ncbi:MAG TPA: RelA/SpoT family protein [Acidobacteriota bacterium]|nr:RelA/SpoT family protein [Acidobacteriota bacterium]
MPDRLFAEITSQTIEKNQSIDVNALQKAYHVASRAHAGELRKSGEPYILHPLRVAQFLISQDFIETALLSAAICHDVLEDSSVTPQQLSDAIGPQATAIVQSLTKLTEQEVGYENFKAENLRKIILATAKDVRVMLIKLADRLDNMRTLDSFREEKRVRIATETLAVYAPMAEKIGLYQFKSELEDLSLKHLDPTLYAFIKEKVNASKEERAQNTKKMIELVQKTLDKHKVPATISGRAKHFYSIYKKMKDENKTISQIYDMYGLRIIVEKEEQCYRVYEILKTILPAIPNRFKDYIKNPKANGYQSLHENFRWDEKVVEVQIKTKQMDYQAESGLATHWKYKGTERDKRFDRKINWLKQLLRWKSSKENKSLTQNVDFDLFKDEIIVITPQGDPIILGDGATPIDFGYMIHSGVGDHIKSAKVNGKIVPLDTKLQSGDIVSIETSSALTVNAGWLSIAKNTSTQQKIRHSLHLDADQSSQKKNKVTHLSEEYQTLSQFQEHFKRTQVKISKCCNPTVEDPIVAFYTKTKKLITIHKFDCPHQHALDPKNKVVLHVEQKKDSISHTITILVDETAGVLIEVLNMLLHNHILIERVESKEARSGLLLAISVKREKEYLKSLLPQVKKISGVIDARVS